MAVPKKRVSKTRGSLRHTNWKKQLIPQALIALSMGKKQLQISSRESVGERSSAAGTGTGSAAGNENMLDEGGSAASPTPPTSD